MAQRDLVKLLQDFKDELAEKGGATKFRVNVTDIWEHRLIVNKNEIKQELRIQLAELTNKGREKGKFSLSVKASEMYKTQEEQEAFLREQGQEFNENKIDQLADFYINNIEMGFSSNVARGYIAEVIRTAAGLEVIFRADPKGGAKKEFLEIKGQQGAVFANLGKVFSAAKSALNKQIDQKFKIKITPEDQKNTFQVGHITAVAQLRAGAVLSTIQKQDINALLGTLQFSGLSDLIKRNAELIKKFDLNVAYVKPQSGVANNLASKHDAAILNQVREAVEASLTEMLGKDWANQTGSNSLVQAMVAELVEVATKNKFKQTQGSPAPKKDFSSSKARGGTLDVEGKATIITTKGGVGDISDTVRKLSQQQSLAPTVSLRQLIPLLNMRLPEVVRSKMGRNGRLVNRTGRFAESTEIVDIGENMVVSFSYMRNPYGVFEADRNRDPRPLIEESIRDLAAGLIREKFSTRRV